MLSPDAISRDSIPEDHFNAKSLDPRILRHLDILWTTATEDLPGLLAELDRAIAETDG
jgi:hypothetical protein